MKPLIITFALIAAIITTSAHAEHPAHMQVADKAICENSIFVKVDGLVCDFCARALEKVFAEQADVATINVDLDNGLVTIAMMPDQTMDDVTVTQLITDSGYNVSTIEHGC